ncbi:MAG: hypothetical protein HND52_18635 [Ignavibacteriae bacterium]|nr:hypothetical protein [Ignavibacteriota bacterium]NOG99981.1 hypothetical protein [Ignavibacteriota bacterium]
MYLKLLVISVIIFSACGKGIEPEPEKTEVGFSGTITFIGEWDENITSTNIVLFKNEIKSAADFDFINIKYASEVIPFGAKSYSYNTSKNQPVLNSIEAGDFAYLAVAQTTETEIQLVRSAWVVAGVYNSESDSSEFGKLTIPEGEFLSDINIVCDFNNPPPQPPGGK